MNKNITLYESPGTNARAFFLPDTGAMQLNCKKVRHFSKDHTDTSMKQLIKPVLSGIEQSLIGAFASLDSWFDRDELLALMAQLSNQEPLLAFAETVQRNRWLLVRIQRGTIQALAVATQNEWEQQFTHYRLEDVLPTEETICDVLERQTLPIDSWISLQKLRRELRDQLGECLYHLDVLVNGEGVLSRLELEAGISPEPDVYACIYFVAWNIRRQIQRLEQSALELLGE